MKYTIEDLSNGICALEYDGTSKELLRKIIKLAAPRDPSYPEGDGVFKYYFCENEYWTCDFNHNLPAQSIHDFQLPSPVSTESNKEEEGRGAKEKDIHDRIKQMRDNTSLEVSVENILCLCDFSNWNEGEYIGDMGLINRQKAAIITRIQKWVDNGMINPICLKLKPMTPLQKTKVYTPVRAGIKKSTFKVVTNNLVIKDNVIEEVDKFLLNKEELKDVIKDAFQAGRNFQSDYLDSVHFDCEIDEPNITKYLKTILP